MSQEYRDLAILSWTIQLITTQYLAMSWNDGLGRLDKTPGSPWKLHTDGKVSKDQDLAFFLSFKFWNSHSIIQFEHLNLGFPGGSGEESSFQGRRCKRRRFDAWVGKIPLSRECQPTLVFLPGEFQGQRNLVGYSPWGCKEMDRTEHILTLSSIFILQEKFVLWNHGKEESSNWTSQKQTLRWGFRYRWLFEKRLLGGATRGVGGRTRTGREEAVKADAGRVLQGAWEQGAVCKTTELELLFFCTHLPLVRAQSPPALPASRLCGPGSSLWPTDTPERVGLIWARPWHYRPQGAETLVRDSASYTQN